MPKLCHICERECESDRRPSYENYRILVGRKLELRSVVKYVCAQCRHDWR